MVVFLLEPNSIDYKDLIGYIWIQKEYLRLKAKKGAEMDSASHGEAPHDSFSRVNLVEQLRGIQSIDWCSPRRNDDFAEYRDDGFLDLLGLGKHSEALASFWPKGGP